MKYIIVAVVLLLAAGAGQPQEAYQVLRGDSQGFAKVIRGKPLKFPRDHAPHPDFRIEWWYITANLQDDLGRHWGLQWTRREKWPRCHAMTTDFHPKRAERRCYGRKD